MSSQQFYQRYEHGELDDSADFMEWSSFYDMNMSTQQHLDWLIGGYNDSDKYFRKQIFLKHA